MSKKKKYYAGIGSRRTPTDVLKKLTTIAENLQKKGYILRSGGADGADSAFEAGSGNKKVIYLPWKNFNKNTSPHFTYTDFHRNLAEKYHPVYGELSGGVKKMMQRNVAQILGMSENDEKSLVVICWTDSPERGGTSQALRIAKANDVPIYNLFFEDDEKKIIELGLL